MRKKHPDWRRDWHRHDPNWWDRRSEGAQEDHPSPPWGNDSEWRGWEDWEHRPPIPPWFRHTWARERRRHSDKFLFARFAIGFGLFVLLGCGLLLVLGAMAALFFRSTSWPQPSPSPGSTPGLWLLGLLGAVLVLVFALRQVGNIVARRLTMPLNETMKAADALAEGDLSARVPEEGSGDFYRFTRSFNRMAEALETADRQRRELLADVAHELRTPLTVIQGNLEGLRDGIYDATPEHLELVLDETRQVSHLVDDLRLLTLAEAGQLPLDLQVLDVAQLLADVRDAFVCQADDKGVGLGVVVSGPLPPLVADPQRLGQILANLMTNALRHTPPGGEVTLGAALDPEEETPRVIQMWVSDTGEGIPAEDLPRIFDRFWRGDPARSHEAGAGSGLGLAIARSLVEAHGGRIWAQSPGLSDQGTIVSCVLPLSPPAV